LALSRQRARAGIWTRRTGIRIDARLCSLAHPNAPHHREAGQQGEGLFCGRRLFAFRETLARARHDPRRRWLVVLVNICYT